MRSDGQVRFIRISPLVQAVAAAIVTLALTVWLVSMAAMAWSQYSAGSERNLLIERQAQIASKESRQAKYAADLKAVTQDLQKRQEFLEAMAPLLPDDVRNGETLSDTQGDAGGDRNEDQRGDTGGGRIGAAGSTADRVHRTNDSLCRSSLCTGGGRRFAPWV